MIDGQSEQLKSVKKAMKIHEIVSSDKEDFAECKLDLMKKIAMDESDASEVAHSIREKFLPKLLSHEGIGMNDMPFGFVGKMTDNDEDFAEETPNENHDDDESCQDCETDTPNDDAEVDADEIATIHISVPVDKLREVEKALENVLGDMNEESKDHAMDESSNDTGENDMNNKEIEARKAFRKSVLAAVADDEVQSVSRKDKFDHDSSEQYREEDFYNTAKHDLTDPDFDTLDFKENRIPNFTNLVDDHLVNDLGLHESLTTFKFDGTPEESSEYSLDFNAFEIPSQGDTELYNEFKIPSEGKIPHKRTINSSTLGSFDPDDAADALEFALRSAGVEEEDLKKLTYAQGLELFKAIRTASEDREHYGKDGKLGAEGYNNPKSPDEKHENRKSVTEDKLRDNAPKEMDPEKDHERGGKGERKLYSSSDEAFASALKKVMHGDKEAAEVHMPAESTEVHISESKDDPDAAAHKAASASVELYKARLKTAYAMSSKLIAEGVMPSNELEAFADGMLNDGLTVTAMIRQTKLMLNNAAHNAEKYAASNAMKSVRTASTGISFNPSVRGASVDLSGATDIQNALRGLNWTAPKMTGMED
jgi:hypothetical protein